MRKGVSQKGKVRQQGAALPYREKEITICWAGGEVSKRKLRIADAGIEDQLKILSKESLEEIWEKNVGEVEEGSPAVELLVDGTRLEEACSTKGSFSMGKRNYVLPGG